MVPRLSMNRRGRHSSNTVSFNQLERWAKKRRSCLPRASSLPLYLNEFMLRKNVQPEMKNTVEKEDDIDM